MIRSTPNQTLTEKANAAFDVASNEVLERARQTGTPLILWEAGKIQQVDPAHLQDAAEESDE